VTGGDNECEIGYIGQEGHPNVFVLFDDAVGRGHSTQKKRSCGAKAIEGDIQSTGFFHVSSATTARGAKPFGPERIIRVSSAATFGMRGPLIVVAIVAILLCAGCILQAEEITGERRERILEYADPIAENILLGMNDNNYTRYSRDFSPEMMETEGSWTDTRNEIYSEIGDYLRTRESVVLEVGKYVRVNYNAEFQNESEVMVGVVFVEGDADHQVHGLWFDSPKLRS
jgi:hypothetical protein